MLIACVGLMDSDRLLALLFGVGALPLEDDVAELGTAELESTVLLLFPLFPLLACCWLIDE